MPSFFKASAIIIFLVLAGVGCLQLGGGGGPARDGGFWKSADRGEHWLQKTAWPTSQGLNSISQINVAVLAMDPQDHLAIYLGSQDDGLFYSYDSGETWQRQKQLNTGRVLAVAVDPKDRCTIYLTLGPRLWKSTDCNRSYDPVYFESRSDQALTVLAIDWFNPAVIYVGTTAGDLLKSLDGGASWAPIQRFNDRLTTLYLDPRDSRVLYAGLADKGIWKTIDGGATWNDLSEGIKEFDRGRGLIVLTGDRVTAGLVVAAMRYGLLQSVDGGTTWQALKLATPPGSVTIHSLALNPKNGQEIYYGTNSTFYRTSNGGANWSTEKLPTRRAATALLVDSENPSVIYLGVTMFKK